MGWGKYTILPPGTQGFPGLARGQNLWYAFMENNDRRAEHEDHLSGQRRHQLSQGPHAGRLVFPAYALDARTGRQQFRALYSDDGGNRWQAGAFAPLGEGLSSMSETQLLPCPDGALLAFSRTTNGFVARTVSLDGGATWQPPVLDSADYITKSNDEDGVLHVINKFMR